MAQTNIFKAQEIVVQVGNFPTDKRDEDGKAVYKTLWARAQGMRTFFIDGVESGAGVERLENLTREEVHALVDAAFSYDPSRPDNKAIDEAFDKKMPEIMAIMAARKSAK